MLIENIAMIREMLVARLIDPLSFQTVQLVFKATFHTQRTAICSSIVRTAIAQFNVASIYTTLTSTTWYAGLMGDALPIMDVVPKLQLVIKSQLVL
jgi:hypothetical protein